MLMVGTKHRADRISIRGLLTVREGERGSQRALIPPASLPILEGGGVSVGAGGWERLVGGWISMVLVWGRRQVQYLHLLDHMAAPLWMRSRVLAVGWRLRHGASNRHVRPSVLTAPRSNIYKLLPARRSPDASQASDPIVEEAARTGPPTPSFSLTSVSVTVPLTPAISGTSACLRRSPAPAPRGSARNAQALFELKGLPTLPAEGEAFLCRSVCFCSFLTNRGPLVSAERKRHSEPDMFRLESSQDCRHTCSRVTKGCYRAEADRGSRAGSSSGTGAFSRWKCTSQTHSVCG